MPFHLNWQILFIINDEVFKLHEQEEGLCESGKTMVLQNNIFIHKGNREHRMFFKVEICVL